MPTNVSYSTVKYRVLAVQDLSGSILTLEVAADTPEGSVLAVDTAGKAKLAGLTDTPIGVALKPAKQGTRVSVVSRCILQNDGTSLSLTVGGPIYNAAAGAVSSTQGSGAQAIGVALGANKFYFNK